MSDSQTYEEIEVSAEGVTVLKRFEEDEFPVPAIAFELVSERDEPVMVRMVDSVPDSVAVEDLGFHPEYGSEFWTIENDTITFERELDAGSSFTTVYGIRATGTDDIKRFLTDPDLADVDPPLPEDTDDTVEDAIGAEGVPDVDEEDREDEGDAETETETEAEADDEEEGAVDTIELNDPTADDPATDAGPDGAETAVDAGTNGEAEADPTDGAIEVDIAPDAEPDDAADADGAADDGSDGAIPEVDGEAGDRTGPAPIEGSLAAALAEEIRSGDVPESDLDELREALDGEASGAGSLEARIDRIQGDVADLRAYTDSLEEFLDENGTGQELIQDARTRLEDFAETVDRMDDRIDETEETVETVEAEVESVSEEVDDIGEEVSGVSADVETVEDGLDDVEADLDGMADRLEGLETDLSALEEEVADEELPQRLADLEEEIEDLREWQTQIRETFGG